MSSLVVTHLDLDGIVCAAIVIRTLKRVVSDVTKLCRFSSVSAIPKIMERVLKEAEVMGINRVFVCDLCPQPHTIPHIVRVVTEFVKQGVEITWIDHHNWSPEAKKKLSIEGTTLVVNSEKNSCAEVVAEYLARDHMLDLFTKYLVELAKDSDTGTHSMEISYIIDKVLKWFNNMKLRYKLLNYFVTGRIDEKYLRELAEKVNPEYSRYLAKVLENISVLKVENYRVVVARVPTSRILVSDVRKLIEERYPDAALYVLLRPDEMKATLVSKIIDVSSIARKLGGGGHREVAAIPYDSQTQWKLLKVLEKELRKHNSFLTSV